MNHKRGLSIWEDFSYSSTLEEKPYQLLESHPANHATEALFVSWAKGKRCFLSALLGFWDCFFKSECNWQVPVQLADCTTLQSARPFENNHFSVSCLDIQFFTEPSFVGRKAQYLRIYSALCKFCTLVYLGASTKLPWVPLYLSAIYFHPFAFFALRDFSPSVHKHHLISFIQGDKSDKFQECRSEQATTP